MSEILNFKFLKDRPLKTTEEIQKSKFGHKEIAKTLVKIVTGCPAPFTIGLFGRWGSGKSTIANFLKNILLPSKIPVIIFDVWKHKGDALRRTFLKEITKQLRSYGSDYFDEKFVLDERIEYSISKTSEGRFKINKKKLRQIWKPLLGFVIALVITGVIAFFKGFWSQFIYGIGVLSSFLFGGSFLLWLVKNAVQVLITETTTFGQDRFADPHQFEEEFENILRHLVNPRIVIIFDNLDRVAHDKSVEVLSTIKTFLEPKDVENKERDVVFLIPCDANAVRQHIASVYKVKVGDNKSSPFSPDEFLKKFFNSTLWIPEFIPGELEAYARNSLHETEVIDLDNDKVAWVITKAFRDNPRQIIQFINILLANYLLIKEREGEDKDFPSEFLSENIPQLAKYLILSELFPNEMEELRQQKVLNLQEVTVNHLNTSRKEEFINFVKETGLDIPITNLRIFFTLRRSEHEKKFPGIEAFIAFLEDRKLKEAQKYFDQFENINKAEFVDAFSYVIKTELENKINPVSIASLIATLLSVLDNLKVKLTTTAYGEIYNKLAGQAKPYLHTIDPRPLNRQLLEPYPQYRAVITQEWIRILDNQSQEKPSYNINDNFITTLLLILGKHPDYLDNKSQKNLQEILAKERFSQNVAITKTLTENKTLQGNLISSAYISAFIEGVKIDSGEKNILDKLEIFNLFETDLIDSNISNQIIGKMNDIQTAENRNTETDRIQSKENFIKAFIKLLSVHSSILSDGEGSQFDIFAENIIIGANAIPDLNQRRIFIPLLLKIKASTTDSKSAQIHSFITGFLNSAEKSSIDYVAKNTPSEKDFIEQSEYAPIFEKRSLANQDFFDYIYGMLSKEKKPELLEKLFDVDYNRALQKIESLDYQITNSTAIVEKVFNKIDEVPPPEKARFLKLANTLKCGNDAGLRDILVAKVKTYLTSTNSVLQTVGFNGLSDAKQHIGEGRLRQLTKDVFDWIRKPEVANKYQPSTIRVIYLGYSLFNKEEQKELQQFLFEELIRKGLNQESIEFGFNLLKEIMPKYEDRKQNFNDIKTRIESEQDDTIKNTLIIRLKDLKPFRLNNQNRKYWEWVNSLKE